MNITTIQNTIKRNSRLYLALWKIHSWLSSFYVPLFRNIFYPNGKLAKIHYINLEWWNGKVNIGDQLAPVIYDWMLMRKNVKPMWTKRTIHLLTVGSILGIFFCDGIVWGSGILGFESMDFIHKHKRLIKYDIRAVRGPLTAHFLETQGYKTSNIFGDPGILMPLIFTPSDCKKRYKVSIIHHISQMKDINKDIKGHHYIDVKTSDYRKFITEICQSKLIISSSLHGIILAESYGIPAIFLNEGVEKELFKYYDWYFSTGRYNVIVTNSIDEALNVIPMPLPELDFMRKGLLDSFPYEFFR